MGARGPAPTPTKLRLIHGNPGKRPLPKNEPQPAPGAPGMPTWLGKEAKAEWRRITAELEQMGLLYKVDRALITAWCDAWQDLVQAAAKLKRDGLTTVGNRGTVIAHPAAAIKHRAVERINRIAQQFGCSPSARTRIKTVDQPKDDDSIDRILKRGRAGA